MTHASLKFFSATGKVECTHLDSGASIETVAPKDVGGLGSCFSPTDLVGVSLASCILITMGLKAKKMGYSMDATAHVQKEMSATTPRRIGRLKVLISCKNAPSLEIQKELENVALHCPVHFSLHPDVKQEIEFSWETS